MNLTAKEIPCEYLCSPPLKEYLYILSLARNNLVTLPSEIVQRGLIGLETLNLQQCQLVDLPGEWDLPHLKRLDLSHNKMVEVDEVSAFYM